MRKPNSEETEMARVMLKAIGQIFEEDGLLGHPCAARVTMLLKEIDGCTAQPRVKSAKAARPAGVRGRR
jgi:hypothetical protein